MKTPHPLISYSTPTPPTLENTIRQKLNALEIERDRVRAEIDQPPVNAGVFYFTDRTSEHRTLCLMIDAIKDLLR